MASSLRGREVARVHGHHHGFLRFDAEQPCPRMVRGGIGLIGTQELAGYVGIPVDAGVLRAVHDDGERQHGEDRHDVVFPQPGQGLGDILPDAEPMPDGIEFVAVAV